MHSIPELGLVSDAFAFRAHLRSFSMFPHPSLQLLMGVSLAISPRTILLPC